MLNYDRIKRYYDEGLWIKEQVTMAVVKNKITKEEYKQITGESYISPIT